MMSDDFIPYGKHKVTDDDIQAVVEVLSSQYLTQGPLVNKFELALTEKVNASYAVAVNSATSALHIACLALNLGPGDWLWTSPITFVATANCAIYCGAKVDFVDIDASTGLMSIEALRIKLEDAKRRNRLPKVLIPVHLGGSSCDMKSIAGLAKEYGFFVIEDSSHAIGGYYKSEPVGSCKYSNISIFSFHPVKIITTGEGGCVTTNNEELYKRLCLLRSHGITKEPADFLCEKSEPWTYEQHVLGFNYRITDIQTALGLSQIKRLTSIVNRRNQLLDTYTRLLKKSSADLLEIPIDVKSSVHLAIIRLHNKSPEHHRRVFSFLRSEKIGVQLHYIPVHLQPYYKGIGFKEGDFPLAESYSKNAISLPLYPELTNLQMQRVVETLDEAIKNDF